MMVVLRPLLFFVLLLVIKHLLSFMDDFSILEDMLKNIFFVVFWFTTFFDFCIGRFLLFFL